MGHPIVRGVLGVLAVVAVLIGLKIFGVAPDDVFIPRSGGSARVSTPWGSISAGAERDSIFQPLLLAHVLSVPAAWRLCSRLGYSSWFGLAMLVPLANIFLLYFLAFAKWPVEQQQPQATAPPAPSGPSGAPGAARHSGDVIPRIEQQAIDDRFRS
jgi:hypothetical protein